MQIVNIAGYKFVALSDPKAWRTPLRSTCVALGLKGTVLLAPEGINLFLAGAQGSIDAILEYLRCDPQFEGAFADLRVKTSLSEHQPFRRMLVRIKKEIITLREPAVVPEKGRAPAVSAQTLRRWLDRGTDENGRPIVLLDTRNAFEVSLGSFDGAHQLHIRHFGEFPEAFRRELSSGSLEIEGKHVVTFCTGGIRCEKAALLIGSDPSISVSQLDGGILQYFEDVGQAHWRGECFVFDHRVALDPALRETGTAQCFACRSVVSATEQNDARYVPGQSCPRCAAAPKELV
ncbi:MAG: sulfurtransferase [Burkholderiaceae bacterium]|jgi:UPF0176 protein